MCTIETMKIKTFFCSNQVKMKNSIFAVDCVEQYIRSFGKLIFFKLYLRKYHLVWMVWLERERPTAG